jgi:hypothetical protein
MTRTDPPTPAPEVQYLPTLFRRIRNGEIRVPAFQRGFVWSDKQILELLESVLHGFPVGSLLLWKVDEKILKIESQQETAFPNVDEKYPLSYILDGMQRLSTLYGVASYDDAATQRSRFNVIFDLEAERFLHYDQREQPRYYLRLSDLFSPRRLINAQAYFAQQDGGDTLIERTVSLHAVFQEYLVPTVTIAHRDVGDVVQIFERVNSTGTNLGSVDFMRAVTWSEGFDLNEELRKIRINMEETGFLIPDETVVKILGIVLGKAPLPDLLLTLRAYAESDLHAGVARTLEVLRRAVRLLEEIFQIQSYDYVPYEGQMLVLAKILLARGQFQDNELDALRTWYWRTSLNEALQGRPDHYVARLVDRAEEILEGNVTVRQTLDVRDFIDRSFTKGKALSSAVASMFAWREARSLATGNPIPSELYMSDFSQTHFERVLPSAVLSNVMPDRTSNRVVANMVLMPEEDRRTMRAMGFEDVFQLLSNVYQVHGDEGGQDVLDSQFISANAVRCMQKSVYDGFLWERAEAIYQGAAELMKLD